MSKAKLKQRKLSLYGHFGANNFGNESTLQAMLYHVRRLMPDAEVTCICTAPEAVTRDYEIAAVPISAVVFKSPISRNSLAKLARRIFIGVPSELYRWLKNITMLRDTDALIIVGTGLLTDAYGLMNWGPYSIFKWSVSAKSRGCKLLFVSVGAGPIHSRVGKWLATTSLALADFRSYRDNETKEYLSSIGVAVARDKVYPDLAFSIAEEAAPKCKSSDRRSIVGLGLMLYNNKLSSNESNEPISAEYLEQLVVFVRWLLARDYDIRLLIGDHADKSVIDEFKTLLRNRLGTYDEARVMDDPISSVETLLTQLAETDVVVATRFHNVLWALALNKPVISISFHQKCTSLMRDMGLQSYCQDIHKLSAAKLIEQFCQLEKNAGSLKQMIREKVIERRTALNEQYNLIFNDL
jgi:polysaccharide pyruvyl transferase WcaK-like protein